MMRALIDNKAPTQIFDDQSDGTVVQKVEQFKRQETEMTKGTNFKR